MVYCPNDSEQYVSASRPMGNGGIFENTRADQNPIYVDRDWAESQIRERAASAELVDAAARAIDGDTMPGQPVNSAEGRSQVNTAARHLTSMVDRAIGAADIRLNEFNDATRRLSGATVSDASKWLDFTNKISKVFVNKSAQLNKYFVTNFGTEGRSIIDNSLVAAYQAMDPAIQGQLQIYTNVAKDIMQRADPVAKRLGWDTKDVMVAVGDYMNGQHAPERNALLISRWQGELAIAKSKTRTRAVQKNITELEAKIDNLQRNLDNLVPVDIEGNEISIESSGYTNAEARKLMQDVLDSTGMSRAEVESIAVELRDLNRQILQDRIDRGLVKPEVVADFPEFDFYVPYRTKFDNTTGIINDASIYNPGKYHAIDGTRTKPDSAFLSIMHHAQRASTEIGGLRFANEFAAAHRAATLEGRTVGIEAHDAITVARSLHSKHPGIRKWAENLYNRSIVVDVPAFNAEGNATGATKKMLYTFDESWTDPRTRLTGAELNNAMLGTVKSAPGFEPMAKLTGVYGQMFTRYNPVFAPVNGLMRDPIERVMHMVGRDYYDSSGNLVRGSSLVGNYLLNMPRSGKFLYDALRGQLDPASPGAQYWREYVENGLHQQYTQGQAPKRRTLADVLTETRERPKRWTESNLERMPGLKKQLDEISSIGIDTKNAVMNTLDGWNDYFNNINIFNQYITLRKAGLTAQNASKGTLELFDLYQTGTIQPFLSMMFPFVRPAVQTGTATARTLGLAPNAKGQFQPNLNGAMGIIGAIAGYTALMPLIKESLGYDETGKFYRFDQLGLPELQRFIPIGIGSEGDYTKLHIGFGLPQIAATLAVGMDRVQRGVMQPEELVFETLYTLGKNVAPGDFPEFSARAKPLDWLTHVISPTILKPILSDVNFMGRPITTARADGMKPMAEQGLMGTERVYHRMAKTLYESTNIDMAPEQVRNWIRHLSVGPLRLFKAVLEGGELPIIGGIREEQERGLRTAGQQETAAQVMGPFFSALGGSLVYGRAHDTQRAMYYQALNEYKRRIRTSGIEITSREYGSNVEKREAFQQKELQDAGWSSTDIKDFLLLMRTESELRSNNSNFNQAIRPIFLSSDDSTPIRREFETLATRNGSLYSNVVPQLNYYMGAR